MITLKQIRQKLIGAIKQSKFTQKEIADSLGISPSTISHYIKGDKMPSLDTLANLCAILCVDANDILCIGEYTKD